MIKGLPMDYRGIAAEWRNAQPEHRAQRGIVLIWEGQVYGWKEKLRDACHERPNAIAVDADGHVYKADGGNDNQGAAMWVVAD